MHLQFTSAVFAYIFNFRLIDLWVYDVSDLVYILILVMEKGERENI